MVIPGCLAVCRATWCGETMAVAAHLPLTQSGGLAWDVQRYHCTSALFLRVPLVASMVGGCPLQSPSVPHVRLWRARPSASLRSASVCGYCGLRLLAGQL